MHYTNFKTNSQLKNHALQQLKGFWFQAIIANIILSIFPLLISILPFGFIATILISGPLSIGSVVYFTNIAKGQKPTFETLGVGFKDFFSNFLLYSLIAIYVFLWSLLFLIPGIVKMYSYFMAYYIKSENPDMPAEQAILASMQLMQGHKLRLFILTLSFIGWIILACLTLGIGFLWLTPYINTTLASFYLDLKENSIQKIAAPEIDAAII